MKKIALKKIEKKVEEKIQKAVPKAKEGLDVVLREMKKAGNELTTLVKKAKTRFEQADEETKKKVVMGLAGAATILATLIGVKKISSRCKRTKRGK